MKPSILYIDQQVGDTREVRQIQSKLNLPAKRIVGASEIYAGLSAEKDPVGEAKKILFLTRNRGAFVRDCPGTRHYTCCGYKILHIGTYCTMDCSYCILQAYFHPPLLQFFVNHEEMLTEIDGLFRTQTVTRIGTGEYTDSLIWEPWTGLSQLLVPKFSKQSHAVLELKTKTAAIDGLKNLDHNRKTIVAWSLNTEAVIRREERRTAALSARLKAAARCQSWGYPLAFHFDPLVIYDGCESDYRRVIEQLFAHVSPDHIVWISLGSFRFMPDLKTIIEQRFSHSRIVYGEFITGLDNKMRYFKPLRIDLYRKIAGWIRAFAPEVLIYFCMEDDEVWQKSLGSIPADQGGLAQMLDKSAIKHCGLEGR